VRESFEIDPAVREYTVNMLAEKYDTSADGS
jgi:hypothetical protein